MKVVLSYKEINTAIEESLKNKGLSVSSIIISRDNQGRLTAHCEVSLNMQQLTQSNSSYRDSSIPGQLLHPDSVEDQSQR